MKMMFLTEKFYSNPSKLEARTHHRSSCTLTYYKLTRCLRLWKRSSAFVCAVYFVQAFGITIYTQSYHSCVFPGLTTLYVSCCFRDSCSAFTFYHLFDTLKLANLYVGLFIFRFSFIFHTNPSSISHGISDFKSPWCLEISEEYISTGERRFFNEILTVRHTEEREMSFNLTKYTI